MSEAIQTIYKGCKFRSRLEARWAVFFDTVGVPYEYEKDGFGIDGKWYLPDFYIPSWDKFVEVDELGSVSRRKFTTMAKVTMQTKKAFLLIRGDPFPFQYSVLLFAPFAEKRAATVSVEKKCPHTAKVLCWGIGGKTKTLYLVHVTEPLGNSTMDGNDCHLVKNMVRAFTPRIATGRLSDCFTDGAKEIIPMVTDIMGNEDGADYFVLNEQITRKYPDLLAENVWIASADLDPPIIDNPLLAAYWAAHQAF